MNASHRTLHQSTPSRAYFTTDLRRFHLSTTRQTRRHRTAAACVAQTPSGLRPVTKSGGNFGVKQNVVDGAENYLEPARTKGVPRIVHWGPKPKSRRLRAGVMGFLGREQQPIPISYGVWGALWTPPADFGAEPRLPKGFPLFSALRMASPDTIILLSCSHWGAKTPVAPPGYALLR